MISLEESPRNYSPFPVGPSHHRASDFHKNKQRRKTRGEKEMAISLGKGSAPSPRVAHPPSKFGSVTESRMDSEATPELEAWCNSFVAARQSASSDGTLRTKPKVFGAKSLKVCHRHALLKREMPAAGGFGCENAPSSKPVPKNLKRQENQHAVHFQAKKWSKLLKKVNLLKKHKFCYLQSSSVCESEACPVNLERPPLCDSRLASIQSGPCF